MSELDVEPWDNNQYWWHTYIFKEFKDIGGSKEPIELFKDWDWDNHKQRSIKDSDCIIYEILKPPPVAPFDEHLIKLQNVQDLYFTHFKEVFKEDFDFKGHWARLEFDRVILPKILFNEISAFIDNNNLTAYKDLIFHIIVKGQDIVTSLEFLHSQYEQRKNTVKNIRKTTETLIKLIDRELPENKIFTEDEQKKEVYQSPLESIQFKFKNKKDTITISDLNFCRDIISSFKDRFDEGFYKNWRKQLKSYQEILISEYLEVYNFKFLYAKALYSFFTQSKIIPLTGKPYPNELMKCIYTIMEYSLIQIGKKDDLPEDKIKDVRNWIRDHKLNKRHSVAPIIADLDKLKKYFEPDFIDSVTDIKKLDSVSIAVFITERFDLQNIFKELVHIISCFNLVNHFYWSPPPTSNNRILPPDYISFKELFKDIKDKKKLSKLSLTIDGKDYTLSDKLPLHIIEQALNSYY